MGAAAGNPRAPLRAACGALAGTCRTSCSRTSRTRAATAAGTPDARRQAAASQSAQASTEAAGGRRVIAQGALLLVPEDIDILGTDVQPCRTVRSVIAARIDARQLHLVIRRVVVRRDKGCLPENLLVPGGILLADREGDVDIAECPVPDVQEALRLEEFPVHLPGFEHVLHLIEVADLRAGGNGLGGRMTMGPAGFRPRIDVSDIRIQVGLMRDADR